MKQISAVGLLIDVTLQFCMSLLSKRGNRLSQVDNSVFLLKEKEKTKITKAGPTTMNWNLLNCD